jgi:hypothetical protein
MNIWFEYKVEVYTAAYYYDLVETKFSVKIDIKGRKMQGSAVN